MTSPSPRAPVPSVAVGEFLRHPNMVGSAFPATKRMVRRMLAPLEWAKVDVLVEYGPGTGRFTFAALARMKPDAKLIAIETGDEFVENLRATAYDHRLARIGGRCLGHPGRSGRDRSRLHRVGLALLDAIARRSRAHRPREPRGALALGHLRGISDAAGHRALAAPNLRGGAQGLRVVERSALSSLLGAPRPLCVSGGAWQDSPAH